MASEHIDFHQAFKDRRAHFHHTYVPKPWTMVHLGGPGVVPSPNGDQLFGYPGITFFSEQNFVVKIAQRLHLQSLQNATIKSDCSVNLLAHDLVNALSNRATNVGSQGALVLASISAAKPAVDCANTELTGERLPPEEDHPKFVKARNEFFNSLVSASNFANALNSSVGMAKTLLGFTNGIGDTSIAALNTVVGTVNSALGTTAAWWTDARGGGTATTDLEHDAFGAPAGSQDPKPTEPAYTAEVKAVSKQVKVIKDVYGAVVPTGVEVGKSLQTGGMSGELTTALATPKKVALTDPATGEPLMTTDDSGKQVPVTRDETAEETHQRVLAEHLGDEQFKKLTAMEPQDVQETDPLTGAKLTTTDADGNTVPKTRKETLPEMHTRALKTRKEKFDRQLDQWSGMASNAMGTALTLGGTVDAVKGLQDAMKSKPAPLSGFVGLSDSKMLLGAKEDITLLAEGGVNVIVPAFFKGFSVLSGAGMSITTLFSSSVFGLQGVSIEGGLSAGLTAGGSVQVGSRRKDVSLAGKQIKIGARAKTIGQMSSAIRQDGKRSWNPQKQLATQSVAVETDVGGKITLTVAATATTATAMTALANDLKTDHHLAAPVIGAYGVGLAAVGMATGETGFAKAAAMTAGALAGIADGLMRMTESPETPKAEPETQQIVISKEEIKLVHHDAKIILKKDQGISISYGEKGSIVIDKEGNITLKGKKLVMDFSESVEVKGGSSSMKLNGGVKIDGKPTDINGTSLSVKS